MTSKDVDSICLACEDRFSSDVNSKLTNFRNYIEEVREKDEALKSFSDINNCLQNVTADIGNLNTLIGNISDDVQSYKISDRRILTNLQYSLAKLNESKTTQLLLARRLKNIQRKMQNDGRNELESISVPTVSSTTSRADHVCRKVHFEKDSKCSNSRSKIHGVETSILQELRKQGAILST